MLSSPEPLNTASLPAAVIHITVPRAEIQHVMGPAIHEVLAAVQAQGVGPAGPVFAHHFGMQPGIFNFEVGVPVSGAFSATGRVKPSTLPGTSIVRSVYTGPYEGLGEAWGVFQDQVEAAGWTLGPNLWERYLEGPETEREPSTYLTELNQTILNNSSSKI